MFNNNLNDTIDCWIAALDNYSFEQLCTRPTPASWSLGQLYIHLIQDTNFYFEQVEPCLSGNENSDKEASPAARQMLANNSFPDMMIEGNPSNANIPQPLSKEQLFNGLAELKNKGSQIEAAMKTTLFSGKTKHPGLQYFNAAEWMQLADMHFRHHLLQKKRIDDFLEQSTGN